MTTTPFKVGIAGRKGQTTNYENACTQAGLSAYTSLSISELCTCDGLILPGGGDITPLFYGQAQNGSRSIDTELDILQIQALDFFVHNHKPILGICKGMQLINIYFGGTLVQDMPNSAYHQHPDGDILHPSSALPGSILHKLYGENFIINSNHHQAIDKLAKSLCVIQSAPDGIIEGFIHHTLPILALQWHPERIKQIEVIQPKEKTSLSGSLILHSFFANPCM